MLSGTIFITIHSYTVIESVSDPIGLAMSGIPSS